MCVCKLKGVCVVCTYHCLVKNLQLKKYFVGGSGAPVQQTLNTQTQSFVQYCWHACEHFTQRWLVLIINCKHLQ